MAKKRITRGRLLAAAAPLVAAGPLAKLALAGDEEQLPAHAGHHDRATGHAAMIGEGAPAVGGPHDLDSLLHPPAPLPHKPGRVREYTLTASDRDVEIAPGVFFPAWTYNGTVPGPVIRATEDDLLRVRFVNGGSHPHPIPLHRLRPRPRSTSTASTRPTWTASSRSSTRAES